MGCYRSSHIVGEASTCISWAFKVCYASYLFVFDAGLWGLAQDISGIIQTIVREPSAWISWAFKTCDTSYTCSCLKRGFGG